MSFTLNNIVLGIFHEQFSQPVVRGKDEKKCLLRILILGKIDWV